MDNLTIVKNGAENKVFWTPEKITLLKNTLCKGISDDNLEFFLMACKRTELDPFAKQIYYIPRGGTYTIQTGIDGYRLIAQRTGERDGEGTTEWCGKDGKWVDVWLSDDPPAAARVTIYRKGHSHPYQAIAKYAEYVQGNNQSAATGMWKKMPANQLAKCAETLALRKAFPQELSGLYTTEEMQQAETPHVVSHKIIKEEPRVEIEDGNLFEKSVEKINELLDRSPEKYYEMLDRINKSKFSEPQKEELREIVRVKLSKTQNVDSAIGEVSYA